MLSGKEIGLDAKLSASDLPRIRGKADDQEVIDVDDAPSPISGPLPMNSISINSQKKLVPLNNFYGQAPVKPKPKGPLYAADLRFYAHIVTYRLNTGTTPKLMAPS